MFSVGLFAQFVDDRLGQGIELHRLTAAIGAGLDALRIQQIGHQVIGWMTAASEAIDVTAALDETAE